MVPMLQLTRREQQYFERRNQGFQDTVQGYRKSDALVSEFYLVMYQQSPLTVQLNMTYFDGIRWSPEMTQRRLNYTASNVFILSLNNC